MQQTNLQFHNSAQAPNHHEVITKLSCEVGRAAFDADRAERNGGEADALAVGHRKKNARLR